MEQLLQELKQAIEANTATNQALLVELRRDRAEWLDPDEACRRLGFPITKSGKHRSRLTWLRKKGFLRSFGSQRPYTYSAQEVKEVANKIAAGKLLVPSI